MIATQKKDSAVKSVESKLATVCVNENGEIYYENIHMDLSMDSEDILYKFEDPGEGEDPAVYYMNRGEADATFTVRLEAPEGGRIPDSGEVQLMHYEGNNLRKFKEGVGFIQGDEAVISLSGGIEMGTYEVFAVYPGSTDTSGGEYHFLAAMSDPIEIRVIDTYHMDYHLNGGANPAPNQDAFAYEGEPVTVTLNTPFKPGYTFEGWYSDQNLTNRLAQDEIGENVRDVVIDPVAADPDESGTSDHTIDLYANWTPVEYSIQYFGVNEGENPSSNPTVYTIESPRIVLEAPARLGYIFCGWYSDQDLTDPITAVGGGNTGDVSVYAKWEEEP